MKEQARKAKSQAKRQRKLERRRAKKEQQPVAQLSDQEFDAK
jgi:hypothetical protein